jgi:hypothetical protein
VLDVLRAAPDALTAIEVVERLLKAGTPLARSTTINHINALIREGKAKTTGDLKNTCYFALALTSTTPSRTHHGEDK